MTTRRRISPREQLAIFNRANKCCHICTEKIGLSERWDIEHVIPLAIGGDEAPMSENLQPAHASCHKAKTSVDSWQIAKAKRREMKHAGIRPRSTLSHPTLKRKVNGTTVPRED